jgi:hypothetical protein
MEAGKTYKIINTSEANLTELQSKKALEIASIIDYQTKSNPYVETSLDCQYRGWKKSGPSDVNTVTVDSDSDSDSADKSSANILISDSVKVAEDIYQVSLILRAPKHANIDRDLDKIRSECVRLLPSWIKSKIEAGAR